VGEGLGMTDMTDVPHEVSLSDACLAPHRSITPATEHTTAVPAT
jgi:hypothetical protein